MKYIKNSSELLDISSDPIKNLREKLLLILDNTLDFINPHNIIKNSISFDGNYLKTKNWKFNVNDFKRIFVFGIGKASGFMAEAIENMLKDKITGGNVIVVEETKKNYKLNKISLLEGTHPIPTELNIESTNKFLNNLKQVETSDFVIFLISGGGSALLCKPEDKISLQDLQLMNIYYKVI